MPSLHRYQAIAYDERGYELWSDVVEATDIEDARREAALEYESCTTGAYEPGHYKARVMLDAVARYDVKRLP